MECSITLQNNKLVGSSTENDPGTHSDDGRLRWPRIYFGYHACWIGKDENNLEEWNWDQTNRQYILPFNTNEIESIELIYYGRSDYPN